MKGYINLQKNPNRLRILFKSESELINGTCGYYFYLHFVFFLYARKYQSAKTNK